MEEVGDTTADTPVEEAGHVTVVARKGILQEIAPILIKTETMWVFLLMMVLR